MPLDALTIAGRRTRRDRIDERVGLVAAAGADQPLWNGSFAAVVLADVLC